MANTNSIDENDVMGFAIVTYIQGVSAAMK